MTKKLKTRKWYTAFREYKYVVLSTTVTIVAHKRREFLEDIVKSVLGIRAITSYSSEWYLAVESTSYSLKGLRSSLLTDIA